MYGINFAFSISASKNFLDRLQIAKSVPLPYINQIISPKAPYFTPQFSP